MITLLRQSKWERRNGGWESIETQECKKQDFVSLTDKRDLGRALRLAQVAILNPHIRPADILQTDEAKLPTKNAQGFSSDIIHLEICAPGLPELSLVDLPGVINVAPNEEDQHLVKFTEALTKRYAGDPKAIVLLAVSADQDVDTSTAFRFLYACGAVQRTMGVRHSPVMYFHTEADHRFEKVLTKPDLLTRARHHLVHGVLSGKKFKLGMLLLARRLGSSLTLSLCYRSPMVRDKEPFPRRFGRTKCYTLGVSTSRD